MKKKTIFLLLISSMVSATVVVTGCSKSTNTATTDQAYIEKTLDLSNNEEQE